MDANKSYIWVLILIVVENGLVLRSIMSLIKKLKNVLILIVVDNGLVRRDYRSNCLR